MPLQINQTLFNKYRIERLIGEGGFGYVYEATDLNLNRRVAIKELKAELAADRIMFERFLNEARAVAALNDPHIVTLWEYQREGNHHYMVLEYMDGGSLANLITKRGMVEPAEAAIIAKSVCDGLAAVHQQGIVHRDMKPANILLARDGRSVKIGDFGIAHVPTAVSGMGNLTRTGTTMGTPWYMSPEQARGEKIDGRSDLYALGVMLFEMVTGHMYLDFKSDFLRDLDLIKTTLPRPVPSSIPVGLRQIIAKALAKDPARRFQSAVEMSAALQAFVTPNGVIAIPKTDPGRTRVRTGLTSGTPLPMRWIVAGGVIAATLLLICAIALAFYKPSQPAPVAVTAAPDRTQIVAEILGTQTAIARATRDIERAAATLVARTTPGTATSVAPSGPSSPLAARLSLPVGQGTPIPRPAANIAPSNLDRLTQLALFNTGRAALLSLAWLPNGSRLAAISRADISFYDSANLNAGPPMQIDANFSAMLSKDGSRVFVDSRDRIPKLYEIASGKVLQRFPGHQNGDVRAVAVSFDGERLASGSEAKDIRVWRSADGFSYGALLPKHTGPIVTLTFAPNNRLLASGAGDQNVRLWDVTRWKAGSVDWDPGHFLDDALVWIGARHSGTVFALAFSSDSSLLASGSGDGTIIIWRVSDGSTLFPNPLTTSGIPKPLNMTHSLVFSPDGTLLVSGTGAEIRDGEGNLVRMEDLTVRIWRVSDGALVRTIQGFSSFVVGLAFSPDGRYLAVGTADGVISLWGVQP